MDGRSEWQLLLHTQLHRLQNSFTQTRHLYAPSLVLLVPVSLSVVASRFFEKPVNKRHIETPTLSMAEFDAHGGLLFVIPTAS